MTISAFTRPTLPIVIVGDVDHGKSTIVGRLMHETGSLPDGKVDALLEASRRRGMDFEWSFVTDALQVERDQGITIDSSQARIRTEARDYLLIDAPGHREFLRNMITGAATATAALVIVDVSRGVSEQTRRHAYLLSLLGIRHVVVAVNKMDLVGYDQAAFEDARATIADYLEALGLTSPEIVPVSAREGQGIVAAPDAMPWHTGGSILDLLGRLPASRDLSDQPLRFPVQDVYKLDDRRIVVGRIEAGRLEVGARLTFQPSGRQGTVAQIDGLRPSASAATAGQSIGIVLEEDIFVDRGQVAALAEQAPALAHKLAVRLFWFIREPLAPGEALVARVATGEHRVTVDAIERLIDVDGLSGRSADAVGQSEIAEVRLAAATPIPVDTGADGGVLARGVLVRGRDIAGAFVVLAAEGAAQHGQPKGSAVQGKRLVFPVSSGIGAEERARANGHRGGVVWLTGLSGAGKTTLARGLERALFLNGWASFPIDADTVRDGLNSDLGFSDADRDENVRRIGEVARLAASAGQIAIVACIAPRREARDQVRARVGDGFSEVHVHADAETCRARDPKGLYARAATGEIARFTGVSAPYEAPTGADLILDTDALTFDEALGELVDFVTRRYGVAG